MTATVPRPPRGGAWDLLVVGGGSAGLVGARTAASFGASVARSTADKVRLLVLPTPDLDAETVWRAVRDNEALRIHYVDVGGLETERTVEPQHVVVGPYGSYLTAWCHLREDERVFRFDRITRAERAPLSPHPDRAVHEPAVDGHQTTLPASALRNEDPAANTDTALSRAARLQEENHEHPRSRRPGLVRGRHQRTRCRREVLRQPRRLTFNADGPAASGGMDYRNITASGAEQPMGGVFGTGGQVPNHAVFYILVADVDATCVDAEQLGGTVVSKHHDPGPGAPMFAYLRDPSGNQFGVFSPPEA